MIRTMWEVLVVKERKEKVAGKKREVEERTKGLASLPLGLIATTLAFLHGNKPFPLSPLQDKTKRGHHLFLIQTMR